MPTHPTQQPAETPSSPPSAQPAFAQAPPSSVLRLAEQLRSARQERQQLENDTMQAFLQIQREVAAGTERRMAEYQRWQSP
jgi:hypothetical protein